jgi:transcriptional regulator with XRE-family HTH domain
VSSALDGKAGLAEELRRRRTALGWTLEQVAQQAQVSVGMLSLIETGKRRPSLRSWERIRGALGISEPLPERAWGQPPQEISDEQVATLGACLAAVRQATLAELAEAAGPVDLRGQAGAAPAGRTAPTDWHAGPRRR